MGVRRYHAGRWTAGMGTGGVRRYRYWMPLAALALLLAAAGTCGLRAPAPAWAQSPPPAAVNGVTVDNIQATSARLNVSLANIGSLTTTLYVRTKTPADNATWNGPTVRFTTASATATRTITGLIAGAKYWVEVSTGPGYAAADTKGAAFTPTPVPPTPTPVPPTPTPVPPTPTPIPDGRDVVSGAHAYLGTVHIVVGSPGSAYGYTANGEGGLTAGQLPDELFADGTARPVAEITVSSSSELKLRYTDVEAGQFLSGDGLRWLRVRLRAQDNTVIGGANLWDASSCGGQSICIDVGATLAAHDTKAVGVDFFDAAAEALDSAPGGLDNILFVAGAAGTDATGFDQSSGEWIAGGFPSEWFEDGSEKLPEQVILSHGAAGRRLELQYDSSETTGQWKYAPPAYRTHRLVLRDRDGEKVLEWPMQEALEAMSEDGRRCGDASAARRFCLDYYDDGLDPALYRGQVMLLQVEDVTWYAMLEATPGGPVGGQLLLGLFGAMMFGWRLRATRSPQREWIILAAGAVSSVLLPIFGFGSLFWGGAILIIAALAAAGWFFMTRAR